MSEPHRIVTHHWLSLFSPAKDQQLPLRDILGCTLQEPDGTWALITAREAGGRILTDRGQFVPVELLRKERLGVPPGWREAAEKLPQDCTCVTHKGPCWLHMDFMDRERNAELVMPPGGSLAAFIREESTRAKTQLEHMRRLGIEDMKVYLNIEGAS